MSIDEHDEKGPRAATKDDLIALLRSLSDHQVDYVLLGGQALNLHGYMRGTGDIDFLLPMDGINGRKVVDALSILPDNAAKDVDPEWLTESGTIRVADEIIVDLMTVAANGETYNSLKPHIQQREMSGFSFFILDLEGLLKTKISVRPKDKQDAAVIRSMISKNVIPGATDTKEERSTGVFGFFKNALGKITVSSTATLERAFHSGLIPRLNDPVSAVYEQARDDGLPATVRALVKDANMNAFALVTIQEADNRNGKTFAVPITDVDRDRLSIGEKATFQVIEGVKHCALTVSLPPVPSQKFDGEQSTENTSTKSRSDPGPG